MEAAAVRTCLLDDPLVVLQAGRLRGEFTVRKATYGPGEEFQHLLLEGVI